MEIRGFLTTLLALLAIAADAQQNSATPKLVVGITVDQLRQDYMEFFCASSIASLFTGTVPMIHGIVSRTWLDPSTLLKKNCADDPDFMGNYTNQSTSAALLQATTLGDELKIFFGGKSLVYAVAPEREEAVMAAGHAADGAFWIDDASGQWSGTSYYGAFPDWALRYDVPERLSSRISDISWKPVSPIVENFNFFISPQESEGFSHKFAGDRKMQEFKTSARPPVATFSSSVIVDTDNEAGE